MKLNFSGLLYAISYALDCVERELVGVSLNHSKRVAYISAVMGKHLGLSEKELIDLATCAVMHDNALTQFLSQEDAIDYKRAEELNLKTHCVLGQKNIARFPFYGDTKDAILYHHEHADGTGPFGKTLDQVSLYAQLIHFGDFVDVECDLGANKDNKRGEVISFIYAHAGTVLSKEHVELFEQVFDEPTFQAFQGEDIEKLLYTIVPDRIIEYENHQIIEIMNVFGRIIDYKSNFTKTHSVGVANKAMKMGKYYGFDEDTCYRLYVAGMLHDIGKMAIDNDVLEKPDKLTDKEFVYMQNHAWYSYKILSEIEGFEDITCWASLHHEKLNGKGYPFGKTAEQLGQKERMMGCIDIYQALSEPRPYKKGLSHENTITIMRGMAEKGFIDASILEDMNKVFAAKTKEHSLV